jgi:hypothetical protein
MAFVLIEIEFVYRERERGAVEAEDCFASVLETHGSAWR